MVFFKRKRRDFTVPGSGSCSVMEWCRVVNTKGIALRRLPSTAGSIQPVLVLPYDAAA
jgi:hypothetical protein